MGNKFYKYWSLGIPIPINYLVEKKNIFYDTILTNLFY